MNIGALIKDKFELMTQWVEDKRAGRAWPFYSSFDLRLSAFKAAHVDNNLFPAGFNNLSSGSLELCIQSFSSYFSHIKRSIKKIALVPENFTRNQGYIDNIIALYYILCNVDKQVFLSSPHVQEAYEICDSKGISVRIYPLIKKEGYVCVDLSPAPAWIPDIVVLNNDLTQGVFEELCDVAQPIIPDVKYGWYMRRKSIHFGAYDKLIQEFAQEFGIDAWLLSTYTKKCKNINFKDKKGLSCLMLEADKMIDAIGKKYKQYNIDAKPYVFLKADQGTFGMGITHIFSGEELLSINKKTRHSINAIKDGVLNSEILIQEGIPTDKTFNDCPAEDVLYTANGEMIGDIIRFNDQKDVFTNLNSKGMFLSVSNMPSMKSDIDYVKWLIIKLGNLAVLDEYERNLIAEEEI